MIVRTKNSARTLGRVLALIRAQTVATEIIVVDSGSHDETLQMARDRADRVIEIDPASFTFGYALNVGAAVARAPIHFAISSHAFPPDDRWIERSLSKYDRPDVVATSGAPTYPDSPEPLLGTFYQTLTIARDHPSWGLSNTGASWRADIWASFPFDETLDACEDKEWGLRVLAAGGTIAIDAALLVTDGHRRADGIDQLHRRVRREFRAIGSFAPISRFTTRDLIHQWATDVPGDAPYRGWRRRLNYYRVVELLAKYQGLRESRRQASAPRDAAPTHQPISAPAPAHQHQRLDATDSR